MTFASGNKKYNPYDFANPVSDVNIFSGRKKQMDEIKYYLGQASIAPRAINLALLGNRAAGKTSLLNMISIEASKCGFCVVRIDLNEGDVESQLSFFFKLMDSILSMAFDKGDDNGCYCFGGKSGKTYDVYLDMISSYDITDNKLWTPFVFPLQYAKSMSKGITNVIVSDSNIKRDLATISAEVKAPIALLFDECNVLSKNHIILEMIRNIFMNLPGYMLVFTGTPTLFPLMDEIFSPIVRQFKRIDVDSFISSHEVKECIERPLESIGLDPKEVIDFSTLYDLTDIQSITGGRPYEIQLLCHFMYKKYESGVSKKMQLSIDVFDDVIKELSRGKDLYSRDVINNIKKLDKASLKALKLLASCCSNTSFDDIWALEYILSGEKRFTREALFSYYKYFLDNNILNINNDIINFSGDDFDRIYSKYYSMQQNKLDLSINDFPMMIFFKIGLDSVLRKFKLNSFDVVVKDFKSINYRQRIRKKAISIDIDTDIASDDVVKIIKFFSNGNCEVFDVSVGAALSVYWTLTDYITANKHEITLVSVKIDNAKDKLETLYHVEKNHNETKIIEHLTNMQDRADELGFCFKFCTESVAVPSSCIITKIIKSIKDLELKEILAIGHVNNMVEKYFVDKIQSKLHADLAYEVITDTDAASINNIGYVYMSAGDYIRSNVMFERALQISDENKVLNLIHYNLGCLEVFKKSPLKSVEHFTKCIDMTESKGLSPDVECVFAPFIDDGQILMDEVFDSPNLITLARDALKIIEENFTCEISTH